MPIEQGVLVMPWYWKVRIYNTRGHYGIGQIKTDRNLEQINTIQDFYKDLTGARMLLEGMAEVPFECDFVNLTFPVLFQEKT